MTPRALAAVATRELARLHPGYFALVMATGIVSIAAELAGRRAIAYGLLRLNQISFAVLAALFALRIIAYYPRVMEDFTAHRRGPGFFTVVAGTCVLGSQHVVLGAPGNVALLLLAAGAALWVVLIYGFFTAVTVRPDKPDLSGGMNGAWLIAVVATQSVAVLTAQLATAFAPWMEHALFVALCFYLVGAMLYLLTIVLIFYRFTFFPVEPAGLTPPYWINMGAVAITSLAGATLMLRIADSAFLGTIAEFLRGFTLLFWATATWWIPLLLVLGAWRHVWRRYPLRYDPEYWGMVFPLGMYSASTFRLGEALGVTFLAPIASAFVLVATGAWGLAFIGLLGRLVVRARDARERRRHAEFVCPIVRQAVRLEYVERPAARGGTELDVCRCSALGTAPACTRECLTLLRHSPAPG